MTKTALHKLLLGVKTMIKFTSKVTMCDTRTIYGSWLHDRKNKSFYYERDGMSILIEKPDMFEVSIVHGTHALILKLPTRRGVYSAITYAPYLLDSEYHNFIIDNYGSVETFLENYCCTFEYATEKQAERKARRNKGV